MRTGREEASQAEGTAFAELHAEGGGCEGACSTEEDVRSPKSKPRGAGGATSLRLWRPVLLKLLLSNGTDTFTKYNKHVLLRN